MGKVLIVYDSRTGDTERIAELIAEGIRIYGNEAVLKKARSMKKPEEFSGFDAVILGSATYHGQMMEGMKTLLFLAEKSGLDGKAGGAFGAFGWSGEAPDRIYDTMKNILKMDMVSGPLRLKSAELGGGLQMAHEYGREISQKINS